MKTWRTFIHVVFCLGLAFGAGLIGCEDAGDAARDDDRTRCQDHDGDGYGNPASSLCASSALDCNDNDADVYPRAPELCDGIDNQCPGDPAGYGIVDDDAPCNCAFAGGNFLFTLEDEDTRPACPDIDMTSLFPPGRQVGPVALPGFQDGPVTIDIPFGPPIGTVSVEVSPLGGNIRFEQSAVVGSETATLAGVFCPGLPGRVQAAFTVTLPSSGDSCYVIADGAPEGG